MNKKKRSFSKEIFKKDYKKKRLLTVQFGLITYEHYLKNIQMQMYKHGIHTKLKDYGNKISLFKYV